MAVVALTQLAKWGGIPDQRGPVAVLILSMLGVVIWSVSKGTFANAQLFDYFAGWIAVSTSAAGVFGFTRSGPSSLTATKAPPASPGAGADLTSKPLKGEK
jgi:hypothetical protein